MSIEETQVEFAEISRLCRDAARKSIQDHDAGSAREWIKAAEDALHATDWPKA